jgi:hypothetical protein
MQMARDKYVEQGINTVEGWFGGDQIEFVVRVDEAQKELGIKGGIAEIGVYHGKMFILLLLCRRLGEPAVAIDVFDEQWMNWDQSGAGNRDMFEKNVLMHVGSFDKCAIIQNDSLQVTAPDIIAAAGGHRFRLFSVDGSHTASSTANDLALAEQCLAPGGMIFVDDYSNGGWPMVAEGVARFMLLSPRVKIAPVLCGYNKVLFTTLSHHQVYLEKLAVINTSSPMAVREFYGKKCLCY